MNRLPARSSLATAAASGQPVRPRAAQPVGVFRHHDPGSAQVVACRVQHRTLSKYKLAGH